MTASLLAGLVAVLRGVDRALAGVARGIVGIYRMLLSPLLPPACRFHPTCSCYASEAFRRRGFVVGSWLAARRIGRCHPWSEGGLDPVPPPVPSVESR